MLGQALRLPLAGGDGGFDQSGLQCHQQPIGAPSLAHANQPCWPTVILPTTSPLTLARMAAATPVVLASPEAIAAAAAAAPAAAPRNDRRRTLTPAPCPASSRQRVCACTSTPALYIPRSPVGLH